MTVPKNLIVGIVLASLIPAEASSPSAQQVAATLSQQFEVVGFTQSTLLTQLEDRGHFPYPESAGALTLPYAWLLALLHDLGPATATYVETNYSSFLVGVKGFVSPKGLGLVGSSQCYVGLTDKTADLEPYFRKAASVSVDGRKAWTWVPTPDKDHPDESFPGESIRAYAAQIDGGLVLCHTAPLPDSRLNQPENAKDFAALVSALSQPGTQPAVKNWTTLNAHQYWLIRSVRQRDTASGMVPADVRDLILYTDFSEEMNVVLEMNGAPERVGAPQVFTHQEKQPLQAQVTGSWQTTMALRKGAPQTQSALIGESFYPVLEAMSLFGFGIVA